MASHDAENKQRCSALNTMSMLLLLRFRSIEEEGGSEKMRTGRCREGLLTAILWVLHSHCNIELKLRCPRLALSTSSYARGGAYEVLSLHLTERLWEVIYVSCVAIEESAKLQWVVPCSHKSPWLNSVGHRTKQNDMHIGMERKGACRQERDDRGRRSEKCVHFMDVWKWKNTLSKIGPHWLAWNSLWSPGWAETRYVDWADQEVMEVTCLRFLGAEIRACTMTPSLKEQV
jgi:hypothetical protein